MFYERKNSSGKNHIHMSENIGKDFNFPIHLHENYEFIFVCEGMMRINVSGNAFDVHAGQGALILSNQPHELITPEHSEHWLVIFSPDHIPELKKLVQTNGLRHPVITFGEDPLREAFEQASGDPLLTRSVLYRIASAYYNGEPCQRLECGDDSLVCRIVDYIDNHYTEQMSLLSMSKALGYNYRYMSGVVNRFFGQPLPNVVSSYRVKHACELLENTDLEITDIALSSGFGSLRSFNRCFRSITGHTPKEHRKGNSD